jgi:3-hydroxyisobutyrate dehydrogenase-like beta-hydroxyacid dehydrogenase
MMPSAMRVGLLFPGEMGAAIGAAARADVRWASEGRSERTRQRAAGGGLEDVGTVGALVAASDVVLSVCPPAIAEQVAATVAGLGFHGVYVEANAVAPRRMERIAETLEAAGARAVDGSIISPGAIHLYLAGETEDVASVAALFSGTAVEAIPLEGGIGAASALKMAFGGWNKIGIALTAQAHALARAYGAEAALAAEGVEARRILSAAPKAWRWAPEMDEVASTCAELGLPDGIARGAAELYRRWETHRDKDVELPELLEDLFEEG